MKVSYSELSSTLDNNLEFFALKRGGCVENAANSAIISQIKIYFHTLHIY